MTKNLKAVIDADFIKYACACAGEKRSIVVTHKSTLRQKEFNNRTEFYGHHAKKNGGWLAERNKERDSPFTLDEFEITDVVTPEVIENVLHSTKLYYESVWKAIDAKTHKGFIGKGESFRVERSTILKYKGNRDNLSPPVHLQAVGEYMERKLKCEVVTGIEADEAVVMESYQKDNHVVVAVDKDSYSQRVRVYNPNRHEEGIVDCTGLGKIWLTENKDVRAYGLLSLAQQICSQDSIDNFAANSASDIKWGEKSSYKILKDCTTEKEVWEAVWKIYCLLYPEPKIITGWRGLDFEVDNLYVLRENFDMARMIHVKDEVVDVKNTLIKFGII